jgi:hypothetical protein
MQLAGMQNLPRLTICWCGGSCEPHLANALKKLRDFAVILR